MKNCSVENCAKPYYAKGFCNAHYIRYQKGTSLLAPVRLRNQEGCRGAFVRGSRHCR